MTKEEAYNVLRADTPRKGAHLCKRLEADAIVLMYGADGMGSEARLSRVAEAVSDIAAALNILLTSIGGAK